MKLTLVALFLVCIFVTAKSQANIVLPSGMGMGMGRSFTGFPSSQFFQNIVLQSEAQKLLTQPGFPEDLQQRVVDTMSKADVGFNECNTMVATLPWFQIRCVTTQLQMSKNELKVIDDEAKARAAAAAATTVTA